MTLTGSLFLTVSGSVIMALSFYTFVMLEEICYRLIVAFLEQRARARPPP